MVPRVSLLPPYHVHNASRDTAFKTDKKNCLSNSHTDENILEASMKVNEMFITIYFSTGGKLNLEGKEVIQEPQKHRDALTCLHANSTVGCVSSFNPAFTDAWCLQQLHIWGLGQESIFSLAFPAD